jgi:hypothetical protein
MGKTLIKVRVDLLKPGLPGQFFETGMCQGTCPGYYMK